MSMEKPVKGKGRTSRHPAGREALLRALGASVRAHRKAGGVTRSVLAQRAGLSPRFIAQLEAGQANISITNLASVAGALGASLPAMLASATPAGVGNGAAALRADIFAALDKATPERLRLLLEQIRQTSGEMLARPVIALVGLRGAGKSTVGPLLASNLGISFVELDDMIQDLTGLALQEIFELHGEGYYRMTEAQALERLVDEGGPVVVAVSGGVVTDARSFELLKAGTLLVWLQAGPHQHMERVLLQGDRRPMADRPDAMAELLQLLEQRNPFYAQAHLTADTSTITPEACAAQLASEIRGGGARP